MFFLRVYPPDGELVSAHEDATECFARIARALDSRDALTPTASRRRKKPGTIEVRSNLVASNGDVIVELRVRIDDGPNPYDRGMWSADAVWREPPWPGGALELHLTIASGAMEAKVAGAPVEDIVGIGEAMTRAMGSDFCPRRFLFDVRYTHGRDPDPQLQPLIDTMGARGVTLRPDELGGLLSEAARQGSAAWVKRLLQEGADPNALSPWQRPTWSPALHQAARNRNLEIVDLLLAAGADVDAPDSVGRTPLMNAVLVSRSEAARSLDEVLAVVDRLAGAGADLNARAGDRWPLLAATYGGKEAVPLIRRLIELGADPALTDAEGRDTATIAGAWKRDPEVVEALRRG